MPFTTIFVIICLISLWAYVRRGRSVKRALFTALALNIGFATITWGGPLSSGALFLLLPGPSTKESSDVTRYYAARHKGSVDLATGLYVREDEDIVLEKAPAFIWRRAYLSRDRVARHMGIGTTHNADWYLIGDPATVQQIQLIMEDGARVNFNRTTRGSSFVNAMFEHTDTATGFYGARLGWVGQQWALRFWDGTLAMFRACDTAGVPCALISFRDPQGKIVRFNRDERAILRSVDAGSQQLTFEYDKQNRIIRAAHDKHEALYSYDQLGRLERATVDDITRSYTYGSRDEMLTIHEPRRSIENRYDENLRVTRQIVRRAGWPESTQTFEYVVYDNKVIETAVTYNNGFRAVYRWNERRETDVEMLEAEGESPIVVQFERAGGTFIRSLTVFCTRDGRRVMETAEVEPGNERRLKAELIARVCD